MFEELGLRVVFEQTKEFILESMKEIASTLIENFEDIKYKDENLFNRDTIPNIIQFKCKHNGEWDEDGLYIEEYVPYKNDNTKFKELVNKGIIKIV